MYLFEKCAWKALRSGSFRRARWCSAAPARSTIREGVEHEGGARRELDAAIGLMQKLDDQRFIDDMRKTLDDLSRLQPDSS